MPDRSDVARQKPFNRKLFVPTDCRHRRFDQYPVAQGNGSDRHYMEMPARPLSIRPSFSDVCKRIVLGRPMITNDLQHEKLSNTVALGALSPDAISSTAYGPEQIMVELLPAAAMAAFVLLLAGVAWLGYATHAAPFTAGYPSMLSEIGRAVFGQGVIGNVLYFLLQAASAAILYNGANTSFNGFPALTKIVAAERFLSRPLMKRGHRLVFSNAIITLTALAVALLLATGGSVNALVPLFAMGVFSAFAMAGYGMSKHHRKHRGPHWRYKLVVNFLRRNVVGRGGRHLRGGQVH